MKYLKTFEAKNNVKSLHKVIRSDDALKIVDETGYSLDWDEGGCWILADALITYFKDIYGFECELYVIYNDTLKRIEHFIVKFTKYEYLDARGLESSYKKIENIKEVQFLYPEWQYEVIKYTPDLDSGDIIMNKKISNKLADYLKSFGKLKF